MVCTGTYQYILVRTGMYKYTKTSFIESFQYRQATYILVQICTGIYRYILVHTGMYMYVPSTGTDQDILVCTGI